MTQSCPFCIDAYTNNCLLHRIGEDEMMESIHAGIINAYLMDIIKAKSMGDTKKMRLTETVKGAG